MVDLSEIIGNVFCFSLSKKHVIVLFVVCSLLVSHFLSADFFSRRAHSFVLWVRRQRKTYFFLFHLLVKSLKHFHFS